MPFWNKTTIHRHEEYPVTTPLRVHVKGLSGDIQVKTESVGQAIVELHTTGDEQTLSGVRVVYTAETGELQIDTKPGVISGIFLQRHDVDIELVIPIGSDVQVSTASGDIELEGTYRTVILNSASGNIKVDECTMDRFEVSVASGDVHGHAGTTSLVNVVSGDVDLLVMRPGRVEVHSVSGDVDVDIRRGLLTDVNASTLSGDIESNIDFTAGTGSDEPVQVELQIQTLSGDIAIRRE
ncbi:MAG: hypothetical protein RI985_446 [Chloroflexota bacterium]|jgi:DUF4097 and DUF4098 domain-containing protein YvlB